MSNKIAVIKTNREYYSIKDALAEAITVGDLIGILKDNFSEDTKIILSNDGGYTYGYISEDTVIEREYAYNPEPEEEFEDPTYQVVEVYPDEEDSHILADFDSEDEAFEYAQGQTTIFDRPEKKIRIEVWETAYGETLQFWEVKRNYPEKEEKKVNRGVCVHFA